MATPFSVLIERAQVDAESLGVDVPEDWIQGRTVFGGLQLALALRAMRALVPGTAVRSLQATFVAPLAGLVVVAGARRQERDAGRGAHRRWRGHRGARLRRAARLGRARRARAVALSHQSMAVFG
jgi:acyl-CoA thioesterase